MLNNRNHLLAFNLLYSHLVMLNFRIYVLRIKMHYGVFF